jgi:hypothetical protein
MNNRIHQQLARLRATEIDVQRDSNFEPRAGTLLRIVFQGSEWRLLPGEFADLLGTLPDGAGSEAVKRVIEQRGHHVWRGPEPPRSRDT